LLGLAADCGVGGRAVVTDLAAAFGFLAGAGLRFPSAEIEEAMLVVSLMEEIALGAGAFLTYFK
jgi:hypothetical protein